MQNMAFVAIALATGFIFQVAWWRLRGPSLSSILFLFALVFAALSVAGLHWGILNPSPADYARLTLLYVSVVLSYTILCSAVEARSPSLGIITCIADYGKHGCPKDELIRRFIAEGAMIDRLRLMEDSGLVVIAGGRCALTRQGLLFARLFEFGAQFFGLAKGG
jgi:hypothetical protein